MQIHHNKYQQSHLILFHATMESPSSCQLFVANLTNSVDIQSINYQKQTAAICQYSLLEYCFQFLIASLAESVIN
jgi:hypothetical protein